MKVFMNRSQLVPSRKQPGICGPPMNIIRCSVSQNTNTQLLRTAVQPKIFQLSTNLKAINLRSFSTIQRKIKSKPIIDDSVRTSQVTALQQKKQWLTKKNPMNGDEDEEGKPVRQRTISKKVRSIKIEDKTPETLDEFKEQIKKSLLSNKLKKAEELMRESIQWASEKEGALSPLVLRLANDFAVFLAELGRFDEAERVDRLVLKRRTKLYGPNHDTVLDSTYNLACNLIAQESLDEAEEKYRFVIDTDKQTKIVQRTVSSMNYLGWILYAKGLPESAKEVWEDALEESKKMFGVIHESTLLCLSNCALAEAQLGNNEAAEELQTQANKLQLQLKKNSLRAQGKVKKINEDRD